MRFSSIDAKQVEVRDLSKYGCVAAVKGRGVRFEDTTSPVDPGDKGKVAEAVDVCFPEEVLIAPHFCLFFPIGQSLFSPCFRKCYILSLSFLSFKMLIVFCGEIFHVEKLFLMGKAKNA